MMKSGGMLARPCSAFLAVGERRVPLIQAFGVFVGAEPSPR
jgi:hypothetical protein